MEKSVHVRAWSKIGFGGVIPTDQIGKTDGWRKKLRAFQKDAEDDFQHVFGVKTNAGNLRQILLDGVKENLNARIFHKVKDSHIPQLPPSCVPRWLYGKGCPPRRLDRLRMRTALLLSMQMQTEGSTCSGSRRTCPGRC